MATQIESKAAITDAAIDQVIKANEAIDENSEITQGGQLRKLVKDLRDRLETEIAINNEQLDNKVNAEVGKGLSTVDFTQADKESIENFNNWSDDAASKDYVDGKVSSTIEYVDEQVKSVYRTKPSVNTFSDLALLTSEEGDVRNVKDTGDNYVWTTELGWDKLGGSGFRKLLTQPTSSLFSSDGTGWQNLEHGTRGSDWSYTVPAGTFGSNEGGLEINFDASAYLQVTSPGRIFGIRMRIKQGPYNKTFTAIDKGGYSFNTGVRIMFDCKWRLIYRGNGIAWVNSKCTKSGEDGLLHNYFNLHGEGVGVDIDLTQDFIIDFQTYNLSSEDADYSGWLTIEHSRGNTIN